MYNEGWISQNVFNRRSVLKQQTTDGKSVQIWRDFKDRITLDKLVTQWDAGGGGGFVLFTHFHGGHVLTMASLELPLSCSTTCSQNSYLTSLVLSDPLIQKMKILRTRIAKSIAQELRRKCQNLCWKPEWLTPGLVILSFPEPSRNSWMIFSPASLQRSRKNNLQGLVLYLKSQTQKFMRCFWYNQVQKLL